MTGPQQYVCGLEGDRYPQSPSFSKDVSHPHRPEPEPATLHHWPAPSSLFLTRLGLCTSLPLSESHLQPQSCLCSKLWLPDLLSLFCIPSNLWDLFQSLLFLEAPLIAPAHADLFALKTRGSASTLPSVGGARVMGRHELLGITHIYLLHTATKSQRPTALTPSRHLPHPVHREGIHQPESRKPKPRCGE